MQKFGNFIVKRRWWIVAAWLVAALLIVSLAPSINTIESNDQSSFLPKYYESVKAANVAQKLSTDSQAPTDIIVFTPQSGGQLTASQLATIDALVEQMNADHLSHVASVTTNPEQISPTGKAQLATVTYSGSADDQATINAVEAVRDQLNKLTSGTGLKSGTTGGESISYDTQASADRAIKIVSVGTIVLVMLLPALIFRSLLAGLLPLLAVGIVFNTAQSLIAVAGHVFDFELSQQLSILFTVVLFGIGTDYILFLLFRYRERLRTGDHSRQAVSFAISRAGEAIFCAALVVLTSFVALFFAKFGIFSSLAPGLVICVAVMMLAALTLVPALVAVIGPKVFWPSRAWLTPAKAGFSRRVGQLVARRPGRMSLAVIAVLLGLGAFALNFKADFSSFSQPPKDTPSATAYAAMTGAFPAGVLSPTEVYVTSQQPISQQTLVQMDEKLTATQGVSNVFPSGFSANGKTASLSVVLKNDPFSAAAINDVSGPIKQAAHGFNSADTTVYVGGATSSIVDVQSVTDRDLRVIFPIAAAFIFVILGLLLRSLVAPIFLLLCVSLGYVATLGITVLVFQQAIGDPGLISFIPLFMYIFVVAIGTDYNILTITRLREEVREGNQPRVASRLTVEHSSSTVASAGLILSATFASLLLGGISFLSQMGASISVGVALAAFVIAPFLIPSLAAKLGYKIWWPGHQTKSK